MPIAAPALPLGEAGKYVVAAYLVVFAAVLIYVVIMAVRQARLERELLELDELAARREGEAALPAGDAAAPVAERVAAQ